MRADDLAPLLGQPGTPDMEFRQGTIIDWDPEFGTNTIQVGNTSLTDLPTLSANGEVTLYPGDVVGILRVRSQYFILGRIATTNDQRRNAVSAGFMAPTITQPTLLPGTTSTSDTTLWTGFNLRGAAQLYFQVFTYVPASTTAVFTLWVNSEKVADSGTYSAGTGTFQSTVPWPNDVAYNEWAGISLKARLASGTGRVAATFNSLWTF